MQTWLSMYVILIILIQWSNNASFVSELLHIAWFKGQIFMLSSALPINALHSGQETQKPGTNGY